jgi:hypothetical protein
MLRRGILACGLLVLIFVSAGFTDQKLPEPTASDLVEFPVTMRQKIKAGTTPVRTKVQARLTTATLVQGRVVPRNAVISGEIIESVARSGNAPSKLSIRLDMAQWKNGSLPIKVYLTEWCYDIKTPLSNYASEGDSAYHGSLQPAQDLPSLPPSLMGGGTISPGNNPPSIPPAPDPAPSPTTIPSYASAHRAQMRGVESDQLADGSIVITAKNSNLKLGKRITYVFAGYVPALAK